MLIPLPRIGLLGITALSFVFAFSLIYITEAQFDEELQAYFDRTRGLYDNQFITRSSNYLIEALAMIPSLSSAQGSTVAVLEKIDLAYAYLNIGRYRVLYDCTNPALDNLLTLRYQIAQGMGEATFAYEPWSQIMQCQNEIRTSIDITKTEIASDMLTAARHYQFWTNIAIFASYCLGLMLWIVHELQRRRNSQDLHEKVRWQSHALTDHLTGTYNRLAMQQALQEILDNWPTSPSWTLFFYDIDHFKRFNDIQGHVAGDHALKQVTQAVDRVIRPQDKHFRFGGEEFLIIAEGLETTTSQFGERLLQTIRQLNIAHPGSPEGILTISIGIYQLTQQHETVDDILDKVDKLLYYAKSQGRNRIFASDQGIPPTETRL